MKQEHILELIYHLSGVENVASLYNIVLELATFISTHNVVSLLDETTYSVIDSYTNKIYNQLLKDNSYSLDYREQITSMIDFILDNSNGYYISEQEYCPDLYYLLVAIREIYKHYDALNAFILLYKEQTAVKLHDDNASGVNSFLGFTDNLINGYLRNLTEINHVLEATSNESLKYAAYHLFFQCGYSQIELCTDKRPFTSCLVAVQNNRLFRDRENAIIAIGEAITSLNLVKGVWFYHQANAELSKIALESNNGLTTDVASSVADNIGGDFDKEAKPAFIQAYNATIDSIDTFVASDLTEQGLQDVYDNLSSLPLDFTGVSKASAIVDKVQSASKAIFDMQIERYVAFLDNLNNIVNSFQVKLANLMISPSYEVIDRLLNLLPRLVDKVTNWLQFSSGSTSPEWFLRVSDLVSSILTLVDKITLTLNNLLCAIRQLLCIINGFIDFKENTIEPLIRQVKSIVASVKSNINALLDRVRAQLKHINNLVNSILFKTIEARLLLKSYEVKLAIGTNETSWADDFKNAVTEAITGEPSNADEGMYDKLKGYISGFVDNYTKQLDSTASCPPIVLQGLNLQIPDFDFSYTLDTLDNLVLDVRC